MLRFIVRTLGLWLLAGSFAAAVIDGMKSIAGSALRMTTVLETWNDLAPATIATTRTFVETRVGTAVWSALDAALRIAPTWAVLAVLGSTLIALARPRRESIGVTP
jgi:hypothetical protein